MQVIIWRVVRAGRRSTIGNRVMLSKVSEGSNPLLSAKKKTVKTVFVFFTRDSNKEGAKRKKTIRWIVFADVATSEARR